MKKRIVVSLLGISLMCSNLAFAEDYWSKTYEGVQTGIGLEEGELKTLPESIDEYIKNGWNSEFAEVEEVAEDYVSPYQKEIDLVLKLGLMEEVIDGFFGEELNFYPQSYLSYHDYIKTLTTLLGHTNKDLSSLGNISNIVTGDTVLKDFVTLLGYDYVKDGKSYISIAEEYDITDGIVLKETEPVTREQFAKIIVNVLDIDMVSVKINGLEIVYEIKEGNTLLSKMDLYEIKGWVSATDKTNIYGVSAEADGSVRIDSESYYIGESGIEEYLSRYVEAYIRDEEGELTVIYAAVDEKKDNYFEVSEEKIEKINASELEYEDENEKVIREDFSSDGSVIYNGKYIGTIAYTGEKYMTLDVVDRLQCADTDFDGKFDVIFIWHYDVLVVDSVAGNKVLFKNDKGVIDFDNEDIEFFVTLDGEEFPVNKLNVYNVLSVAKTLDGSMYTVVVSMGSAVGTVKSKDEEKLLLSSGDEYIISDEFFGDLNLGEEYTVYMTFDNKIVTTAVKSEKATNTGTGRNYGYLRKCYLDDEDEEAASFRIFRLSDEKWVTLKGAKKITLLSGAVESDDEDISTTTMNRRKVVPSVAAAELKDPQLIVFDTDIRGNISSITTAVDYSKTGDLNDDLFVYNKTMDRTSIRTYWEGYIGGEFHNNKCLLLRVPEDRSLEKNYGLEKFGGDSTIKGPIMVYDADESLALQGVMIRISASAAAVDDGDKKITIKEITQSYEDEEMIYKITAIDGSEYKLRLEDSETEHVSVIQTADKKTVWEIRNASELKPGDMMVVLVDDFGYITGWRMDIRIADLKDMDYFSYPSSTGLVQLTYDYGVLKKNNKSGNNVVVNSVGTGSDNTQNKVRNARGVAYEYNTKSGKLIQLNSKNEILEGESVVLVAHYYGYDTAIIVIR